MRRANCNNALAPAGLWPLLSLPCGDGEATAHPCAHFHFGFSQITPTPEIPPKIYPSGCWSMAITLCTAWWVGRHFSPWLQFANGLEGAPGRLQSIAQCPSPGALANAADSLWEVADMVGFINCSAASRISRNTLESGDWLHLWNSLGVFPVWGNSHKPQLQGNHCTLVSQHDAL